MPAFNVVVFTFPHMFFVQFLEVEDALRFTANIICY